MNKDKIVGRVKAPKLKGYLKSNIEITETIKIYPELEDLNIIPQKEEQYFKSEKYGYDNVIVEAIKTEEIEITPSKQEQNYDGLYDKITVKGDEQLVSNNIKKGIEIFNVEGTLEDINDYFDTTPATGTYVNNLMSRKIKRVPLFDTSTLKGLANMFNNFEMLEEVPQFNTENCDNFQAMFYSCVNLKIIPMLNLGKALSVNSTFYNCSSLTSLGGFKDLGKGYTQKVSNYTNYTLNLSYSTQLTHESLMNVINNLYDLNITYNVAGGGILYPQTLQLGAKNLAKLSEEEIAIATEKGWNVT